MKINQTVLVVLFLTLSSSSIGVFGGNLFDDLHCSWGNGRSKIVNNGQLLSVTLDKVSGSGFESNGKYLFARIDMLIKLVSGNSAGTVTAFFLSSKGKGHDEIDFEFLGNVSGQPYTVHTNVFCNGEGKREQQFRLWFDPTADFHKYSILWSPHHIVWLVDETPIREFKNLESKGVPFPKNKAMKLYSSLWEADNWATRGGLVKIDWSKAPFKAFFKEFRAEKYNCDWSKGYPSCTPPSRSIFSFWTSPDKFFKTLDHGAMGKLNRVKQNNMIYNYCKDFKRFPNGLPKECQYN
ncbi:xyloglucan endotransglucosylase/hydrolase protein 24-like [Humulus lupulus]|uniref:xyloglucan endotransglucosylase/hydrolase protein 24-like n=1 Tax=Humulus lupulus TaxID=3486 RepID=UPI002B415EAE|nr:xyloglucan endotransglucosylase/hydrolase protein 24-like [Humulus lupulus]